MGCNLKIAFLVSAIVGLVLIIVAAVLGFAVLPGVVDDQIDENVILDSNDTEQYERFQKLPFALNFSVTFFSIKNAPKVMSGVEYPEVVEVGPIVYSKQFEKLEIKNNEDDNTIIFKSNKVHRYQANYSKVFETQTMTIINAPLVSVFQIVEKLVPPGFLADFLLGIVEKGYPQAFDMDPDTVFHKVTVGEYAFKGYKFCDPNKTIGPAKLVCGLIRAKKSPTMHVDKTTRIVSFSFFQHKNGLEDPTYEVKNGVDDITKLGSIVKYGGKNRTEYWNDDGKCNQVKGTDSTIYGPHNDQDSIFTIFNTDICRTVDLEFTEEIEYEGIPGYRSSLKKSAMDWSVKENECYCIKETKDLNGNLNCLPNGFSDMFKCLEAPIVLSLPHFLWAEDKNYTATVKGLKPVENDHKIYIDMEPNTGSPMVGHKRVQFNIILRSYHKAFAALAKVKSSVVPMVWIDENVNIPESLVNTIKDQYLTPVTAINISKWVLIGVGIALTLGCGGLYLCKRKK